MLNRVIPIVPVRAGPVVAAPRLSGDPARVERVIGALEAAVAGEIGLRQPTGAWLRALRLADDEAELAIAPGLPHCAADVAQAAFEALRRLLPDTDIYVRTAAH